MDADDFLSFLRHCQSFQREREREKTIFVSFASHRLFFPSLPQTCSCQLRHYQSRQQSPGVKLSGAADVAGCSRHCGSARDDIECTETVKQTPKRLYVWLVSLIISADVVSVAI